MKEGDGREGREGGEGGMIRRRGGMRSKVASSRPVIVDVDVEVNNVCRLGVAY